MDGIKTFPCHNCKEYIFVNAQQCRFCGARVNSRAAQMAAQKAEGHNLEYRRKQYLPHIRNGIGLTLVGLIFTFFLVLLIGLKTEGILVIQITPVAILLTGIGELVYGIVGWLKNDG